MIRGRVRSGKELAAHFTALPWVRDQLLSAFGIDPWPGTLNLTIQAADSRRRWHELKRSAGYTLKPPDESFCAAACFSVRVSGRIPAVALYPHVDAYPDDQLEVIAALSLRQQLRLLEDDAVELIPWETPSVRGVIFDIDGTLVDTIEAYRIVAEKAAAPLGIAITRELVCQSLSRTDTTFWDMVLPDDTTNRDKIKSELRAAAMAAWPDILREHARLMPGIGETLKSLSVSGLRLGIVTGARRGSFEPLKQAGLMGLFDGIITGEDVAQAKPHPEGLLRCVEMLGVSASEAIYVGDTPADMQASRAAGVLPVAVLGGAGDSKLLSAAEPARILSSHRQLPELLIPLERARAP